MALSLQTTILANAISTADGGIPSGYTIPTTSHTFTDPETDDPSFTIAVSGNANSTASTGLTAVVTATASAVTTYVGSTLGLDTSGNTVNMIATIKKITRSVTGITSIFQPGTDNYTVKVDIKYEIA